MRWLAPENKGCDASSSVQARLWIREGSEQHSVGLLHRMRSKLMRRCYAGMPGPDTPGIWKKAHLQAGGVGCVHDDGACGLVPATAQVLVHHHLGHHAVHLQTHLMLKAQRASRGYSSSLNLQQALIAADAAGSQTIPKISTGIQSTPCAVAHSCICLVCSHMVRHLCAPQHKAWSCLSDH